MSINTALAVFIGLLGGLATYAFLADHFSLGLQIWAAFIAWASFFHCGGKISGFISNALANIWGVIVAAATLIAINKAGLADQLTLPVWAGICVGVGVFILILATSIPFLSAIPATVYGFAATAGFALLSTNGLNMLTDPTLKNPAVVIAISMVIGGVLGVISEVLAGAVAKS